MSDIDFISLLQMVKSGPVFWLIFIIAIFFAFMKIWPQFEGSRLGQWLCRWFPLSMIAFYQECKKPLDAIDLSKPVELKDIGKFSAWLLTFLFSLFSAWFFMYGMALGLLFILDPQLQDQANKTIVGILIVVGLLWTGRYYKGCAYQVARENRIL